MTKEPKPRECIEKFSIAMEAVLRGNDDKRGWEHDTLQSLFSRMLDEVAELSHGIDAGSIFDIRRECCDVANFAMMIWDVTERIRLRMSIEDFPQ